MGACVGPSPDAERARILAAMRPGRSAIAVVGPIAFMADLSGLRFEIRLITREGISPVPNIEADFGFWGMRPFDGPALRISESIRVEIMLHCSIFVLAVCDGCVETVHHLISRSRSSPARGAVELSGR